MSSTQFKVNGAGFAASLPPMQRCSEVTRPLSSSRPPFVLRKLSQNFLNFHNLFRHNVNAWRQEVMRRAQDVRDTGGAVRRNGGQEVSDVDCPHRYISPF